LKEVNTMTAKGKFPLKGFTLPLTPKGHSSVVDPPPWHYGGDVLAITFRMNEKKARTFIPPPLEMGPKPGEGIVWFPEWVSVSDAQPDLAFINPERAVYRECFVMLSCQFKGVPGYFVPFIWVDNDFTLMRGFVQGFPKKLGRIYLTKLHELCPKVGGRQKGARIKGILDAHGERVVEGSMVFTRKAKPEELPAVKFYLMRHMPSIDDPTKPAVHELSAGKVANAKIGEVWAGDGDLKFFPSPFEEVADLGPVKVTGAFYFSIGMTITGGEVLHSYVNE
jgi:acetoacetate decarboxylase